MLHLFGYALHGSRRILDAQVLLIWRMLVGYFNYSECTNAAYLENDLLHILLLVSVWCSGCKI